MVPATICLPIGLLITGWTVENRIFWLMPDIVSHSRCFAMMADTYSQTGHRRSGSWCDFVLPGDPGLRRGHVYIPRCIRSVRAYTLYPLVHSPEVFIIIPALAAVSCLRSLAGFGFPLFAPAMYSALGFGKGDTILTTVTIVLGCPAPWLFWKYGEQIRRDSKYADAAMPNM